MKHELWIENENDQTFFLAGPHGDCARNLLGLEAKLVWTSEASSYFEAMIMYHKYMDWGVYKSDYPDEDKKLMQSSVLSKAFNRRMLFAAIAAGLLTLRFSRCKCGR